MFLRKLFPDPVIIDLKWIDTIHGGEEYRYYVDPSGDFNGQEYTRYVAERVARDGLVWMISQEDCTFDRAARINLPPTKKFIGFFPNIAAAATHLRLLGDVQRYDSTGFRNHISGKRYHEGSHDSPPLKKCWDAALRKPPLLTSGREAHLRDVEYTIDYLKRHRERPKAEKPARFFGVS